MSQNHTQNELRSAALAAGADDELLRLVVHLGVHQTMITGDFRGAVGFLSAASYHGLGDEEVADYLEAAGGDPDAAWEMWRENSLE